MILVVGGDATGLGGYAKVAANFNIVTQLHLAPLGHGGPNSVYALVTSRQMKKYGLQKSDYGQIAIAQRTWAANNPYAVYRTPMSMEEYLAAPLVADPLSRYDCVPVVAGAQAIVIAHPDRCPRGRAPVRVRAHRTSFNYDNQEGDGLATGISTFADELWRAAGVGPEDVDVASIYDDYPTMVLAQLNDLGMIPGNDLARFARREIGERRFPVNTWGGMLSAGQPGGPAGGLNGISEAVLQLQHRAGASGEERAARGRHRLRHDHVPLRRHRRRRHPGAHGMISGQWHSALVSRTSEREARANPGRNPRHIPKIRRFALLALGPGSRSAALHSPGTRDCS